MRCRICNREAQKQAQSESKYCELHEKGYQNILKKFEMWRKASDIEWKKYLRDIANNPFTGIWAREVAENLLKEKA